MIDLAPLLLTNHQTIHNPRCVSAAWVLPPPPFARLVLSDGPRKACSVYWYGRDDCSVRVMFCPHVFTRLPQRPLLFSDRMIPAVSR